MAASGTGSLIFSDAVTHDGSSRISSEVYRNIWSANLQRNASNLIRKELHHAARQRLNSHCQHNKGLWEGGRF